FTPNALGSRTAQLLVFGNATNSSQIVSLTGVGANTAPSIQFNPTSLSFGDGVVGRTGTVEVTQSSGGATNLNIILRGGLAVTVINDGTAPLVISGLSFSGGNTNDFEILNIAGLTTCIGTPVAPGGFCTVFIGFSPTATGARSSSLRVLSNAGNGTN